MEMIKHIMTPLLSSLVATETHTKGHRLQVRERLKWLELSYLRPRRLHTDFIKSG